MVYKKYIRKKGKIFGPYYCESYRDSDGNVKTKFVSGPGKKDKFLDFVWGKILTTPVILILGFILFLSLLFFIGNISYTGKVIDDFEETEVRFIFINFIIACFLMMIFGGFLLQRKLRIKRFKRELGKMKWRYD